MDSNIIPPKEKVGVIFDLDGVIISSENLMRDALKYAYNQKVGPGHPPYDEYFKHMGEFFPNIMHKMGLPETMWEPYKAFSSSNMAAIEVFPGIQEQLMLLQQLPNLKLGLFTGKDLDRTIITLEHFNLLKYFEVIVTPEKINRAKPFPDGLLYAADYLGCLVERTLYFGDSVNDMLAAVDANMTAVMAAWGAKFQLKEVQKHAHFIVERPNEILNFILMHFYE